MNRPLNVLSLTAILAPGGTSGRILGMVKGLDRQRISHRVCTLYAPHPHIEAHFGSMIPLFEQAGASVDTLGMEHPAAGTVLPPAKRLIHSVQMLRRSSARLANIVREQRIDVIDAHMAPSSLVASVAGCMTRTPVVVTEYHVGPPAPVMLWPLVGRAALEMADAVVTDSRPRAEDLKSWMYRRKEKVVVIPNGIAPPQGRVPREQVRAQFGIGDDEIVIAQISALRPYKGHAVLLEAAKIVLDAVPRARFLVIGFARGRDREYWESLRSQARRLEIGDRVFVGPYPGDIGDIWNAVDVHAHASLFDSLPNAIIEGMSLGKPAVVTAVGGIPDLVTDKQTGLVVPPNDPQELARALLRLLADPVYARRLGDAAARRYREGYCAEHTARKLEEVFYRVAGAA
jgi:glycosyltransferase involved in cell wall biosynthesis